MSEDIVAFSQRKAERAGAAFEAWPLGVLVEAQQRACRGESVEDIAAALQRNVEDVRAHLAPAEERPAPRPERATLGYAHLKGR